MDQPGKGAETVQHCPVCQCKTWHLDGVCEWSEGHGMMEPGTPLPPPTAPLPAR